MTGRLRRDVDGASLSFVRAAFGLVMAWEMVRFFSEGWIEEYYLAPSYHFTYSGFDWVRPLPGPLLHAFFAGLLVASLLVAVGLWHRLAASVFAVGFTYVFLLEKARYLNHFYLVCLLAVLLAALPVERSLSVDARRKRLSPTVPAWALELVRAQVGLVYLLAGVAKMNEDWLLRSQPLIDWLGVRASHPVFGFLFERVETAWAFSWAGFLIDLFAWPALVWPRTRTYAFLALLAFHLTNAATFGIGIFPWLMIAVTTVFFEPDWPRRVPVLGRLYDRSAPDSPARPPARTAGLALAGAWLAVQILVPLRHFLYPGSVHWTEEGHAFSWHMKLRTKSADAIFVVTDPRSGETRLVDSRTELTPWQTRKMSARART